MLRSNPAEMKQASAVNGAGFFYIYAQQKICFFSKNRIKEKTVKTIDIKNARFKQLKPRA